MKYNVVVEIIRYYNVLVKIDMISRDWFSSSIET